MAPNVDWEAIMAANAEEIQESEDDALVADWCNKLSEVDLSDVKDEDKLRKAFTLAKTLMSRKAMETDLYKEENEELVKNVNRLETTERQQNDEIRVLDEELAKAKRFGDEAGGGSIDPTRIIRKELEDAERELQMLRSELKEKERMVERERTNNGQYQQKIKELEEECKRTEELTRDNERMRSDISTYIQRLKNLTDAGTSHHHDDLHSRQQLQAKSKELLQLNDEYLNLVAENQRLEERQNVMEERMNSATTDMNRITEDYLKQRSVLKENDNVVDSLKRENERLKMQVQDMSDQVKSKGDTEDEIMVAVNNKVEEWKKVLANKDAQLLEYREQVLQQKEQIIAMSMDSERAKLSALERGIEERDIQIGILQEKLAQCTDEMEKSNALMDDLRAQLNKEFSGPGATDVHIRKIKELQGIMRDNAGQAKITEERLQQAEHDAKEKDKQLSETIERMRGYENNTFGLPEAVAEIKDGKLQIQIRDRQIVELTQNVNGLGNQMNDLADENEELRERLGLDPKDTVDLTDYRNRKIVKKEEERAVNQVLQKEVEQLEEERLELKRQIRKLAQNTGQRAVALGLTTDDVSAIDEFTETLKKKRSPYDVSQLKKDAETDELKSRALQFAQESEKYQKDMERIRQTNAELNIRIKEVDGENKKLEQGLKEVLKSVKESKADGAQSVNIESPTLERMLAAIEAKQITGSYDAALHLKAQVDNLTGRNDELRRELRESRVEGNRAKLELERTSSKVSKLEEDLNVVRVAGGMGMLFQTLTLPEGMAVSSADVIASLNEHLVQTLHELNQRELTLGKMEEGLETYKGKYAVVRHQLGLVYKQFHEERTEWQKDKELSVQKMSDLDGVLAEDKVKIQEFDRLRDTLSQDDSEVRRRLADMSRKATVLRVNEKALSRRYAMMQDVENALRKDNTRLKNEVVAMESAVTERLGYLQRYKDMASFKIATLQKTREESVPLSELETANKQYQELTEKYRDLLDRSNNMIAKNEHSATLEMEQKRLQHEKEGLARELEIEKEKTHAYQSSFEQLQRQGIHMTGPLDNEAQTQAKKLATLEMKELNERQRAEHAVRMYEQRKEMIAELENRNSELEQKFAEVTRMNLEAQRTERQLRDELSNCVLKSVSDADRERISNLEASENSLKIESSRLKEIADIAMNQASAMEQQKVSQEKELISLRQQLIDIQAQSDEKKVIGKLHRHIVQLQVSEGTAVKKLEDSVKKITKLQAQLLRMEQRLDEKDQALLHHRAESANKSRHLRRTIHELRRMFSGAVPLSKQERFAKAMVQLQEDKDSFAKQLKQVTDDRIAVEDKLACLKVQYSSLQELISTLKDGKGANKIVEWHGKMEELRLEELKKTRQIQRLTDQGSFMQSTVRQHEVTISNLEEGQVKMNRHYEERQLQWEQREMEMERIINKLENQQQEIAGAASKFEEATGTLPDITLPISDQLEQAIATIKNNVRVIIETQTESRSIKSKLADLEIRLKEADANLLSRDRLIAELRLRMPATAERDAAIAKATANSEYQEEQYETKQALRVAQCTIGSLQARITQKEQTISKLQSLLQQARDEMLDLCNQHDTDMKLMMDRLHIKSDDAFVKFKQTAMSNVNQPPPGAPTSKQLTRLNELEDTLVQQDNQIAALSGRIRSLQSEVERWRQREEHTTVTMSKEKERLIEEHHVLVQKLDNENDELRGKLAGSHEQSSKLTVDLKNEKEAANRGPTAAAKEHIARLKQQIQDKDEELERMTTALKELRADLVQQAEEAVKVNATNATQDWNIQKLIDKRTRELRARIEELETALGKTKGDGKRRLDKEASLHIENEELKDELARKETSINRLKAGKRKLEEDNETLERKLERHSSQKKPGGNSREEVEPLKSRIKSLEQQLSDSKLRLNRAEKPSEDILRQTYAPKQSSAVEKWEETKKQQKMLEKVKVKLIASEVECDKLRGNNEMMKNALDRVTKAKEALEKKAYKNAPPMGAGKASNLTEQELRNQNEQLQNEISDLRQQLLMTRDVAYEEVQMRNRQLTDKLGQLEAFIQQKKARDEKVTPDDIYPDLVAREQKLQADVRKLSEENLSLRFEVTQLQQEVPRLKEKIQSQKMYIEAMKADRDRDTAGSVRSLGSWVSSANSQASMIRKIGESGRSGKDLEKTISLLKRVVEKKQAEIERLNMAPGVVSNERFINLERENGALREQLEDLRSKMGATLTERYEMKDKSTKRLTHDFEKLRKDLRKEQESSEKLQVALNSARLTSEERAKIITELRSQVENAEAARTSDGAVDQKTWKAAAITRVSEEKVVRLTAELDTKVKAVADMKVLLRDSATREKELVNEREEMERKISILERFPPGAKLTDSEVMAQLQQTKLANHKLEDEKAELLNELRKLKGHTAADNYNETMVEKARKYDSALKDQAELSTRLKSCEYEKDKCKVENEKLKRELANFGPEFFEEIEDLKYNYQESEIRNAQLEEKLKEICDQFGVSL